MFSVIYPYLSLLFSHLVFLYSPSFLFSSRQEKILQFTMFDLISLQPSHNITEIRNPQPKKKCYVNYNQELLQPTQCYNVFVKKNVFLSSSLSN